jgi:HTH-type transcriptional regulator/antitoxin HipB
MSYLVVAAPQLGKVLRGLRKSRKLTQVDVARAAGMRQKTVSMLESDPSRSSLDTLMRYLSAVRGNMVLDLDRDQSDLTAKQW